MTSRPSFIATRLNGVERYRFPELGYSATIQPLIGPYHSWGLSVARGMTPPARIDYPTRDEALNAMFADMEFLL